MESWCNLTWTRKSSLKVPFTLTQAFLYINWTIVSNLFNILSFLKAYPMTTLNTWLKTFSKSANAVVQIRLFSKYFFYNCLNIKMAFKAPHPHMKPIWKILSNLSNMPSFLKAYPMTILNTWSKTLSKSTNAMYKFVFFLNISSITALI